MIRTRIAPSPTGNPHIGTIYQALFNYASAKKHQGKFIVRIEDTDRTRFVKGAEEVLFNSLDWFGLTEDESVRKGGEYGPYRQSERLTIYHKYAQELIEKGHGYYDYYKKEEAGKKNDYDKNVKERILTHSNEKPPKSIEEMIKRGDWVVRMRVPKNRKITFTDEIRGEITFDTSEVTEQVLIKSDGFPTYHFAVVVDDHLMGITQILRAEEWLSSTPKHVLLYSYFDWEMPLIYHTATLRNPDKSKLSKRHGHTDVLWFKEEGYLPQTILNFLGLLGWTHPEEKEIFSLVEFIELFELKDIRPIAPIFDLTKLNWMNGVYIREMKVADLVKALKDYQSQFGEQKNIFDSLDEKKFHEIVSLGQSRINTLKEFYPLIKHFLPDSEFVLENDVSKEVAKTLQEEFGKISDWQKDAILDVLRAVLKKHSIRMPVLYTIVTGQERGLPLPESLEILGKEIVISRLHKVL